MLLAYYSTVDAVYYFLTEGPNTTTLRFCLHLRIEVTADFLQSVMLLLVVMLIVYD